MSSSQHNLPITSTFSDPACRCVLCGRPGSYAPVCSSADVPLVVLCYHCHRDLAEAQAAPDGWRYIVQAGHGLESRIGRTRLADVSLPDGSPIFDLATVSSRFVPLVLSILPSELLCVDLHGEVAPVADWIARILHSRRSATRGSGHV